MPQIILFFVLILLGVFIHRKDIKDYRMWTLWAFGFIFLFSIIKFMKAFVFEWLEWNGTEKNDWFYILWWGFNLLWSVFGIKIIKKNIFTK